MKISETNFILILTSGSAKTGGTSLIIFEFVVLMLDEIAKKNQKLSFTQNLSCFSHKIRVKVLRFSQTTIFSYRFKS